MNVIVNVTFGANAQVPKKYRIYGITLYELHTQLSQAEEIGHGRFYRVRRDGTTYPVPFSEYGEPPVQHPDGLYYSVYDDATQEQLTRLNMAIGNGDLATVQELVPSVFNVDLIAPDYGSLLHHAIVRNQFSIVEYLLQQGANINLRYDYRPPLSDAIHTGNLPMVRLLVDNGAEINISTANVTTALHEAITVQNLPIIDYLLRSGADVELAYRGLKPLHMAVSYGNLEMVRMLVEAGADINVQAGHIEHNNYDMFSYATPLIIAATYGNYDIVKYLLSMGADAKLYSGFGRTAEVIARDYGHNGIANLIQEYNEDLMKEPEF